MTLFGEKPAGTGGHGVKAKPLVNLGLAIAVAAGACGLTVSAGEMPSAMPDLHADHLAYELESGFFDLGYERVEILEAGLALDAPISWLQLGQEPAWSPSGSGKNRIAVSWFNLVPTIEPEAILLPSRSLIVASTPIALDWGSGRQYLVKEYGGAGVGSGARAPTLSVEIHTILTLTDGDTLWAYDLHAVAPTEEELVALKPVYDTMLHSMYLTTPPRDYAPAAESEWGGGWRRSPRCRL
jgi:hypothetical protein